MSGPEGFTSFNSTCNLPGTWSGLKTSKNHQIQLVWLGGSYGYHFWQWIIMLYSTKESLLFKDHTFPGCQHVAVYVKIWHSEYQLVQPPAFAIIWNNPILALPLWNQKNYHPTRVFHLCSRSTWFFNNIWCNLRLSWWQGFGIIWPKLRPEFRLENSRCRLSRTSAN